MAEKEPIQMAEDLIHEIGLDEPEECEKFEKCELIAGMAPPEATRYIEDSETRECVGWIKKVHGDYTEVNKWEKAFAVTIESFFKDRGGTDKIKKWHRLEQVCDKLSRKDLGNLEPETKKIIEWIWKIHVNVPDWKSEILEEVEEKKSGL